MVAASARGEGFPRLSAEAAVLMEYRTGHVLYSLNADQELHPASTTKIVTALLGLELGKQHDIVAVSQKAAYVEGTCLYLKPGDRLYLFDLIQGALINSGNDAAAAIAEHLGGTEELFAGLMVGKARTLGAYHSRFCNPHGLTHRRHTTTAYDLALITRYALNNRDFRRIVGTREMTIHELTSGENIYLNNTNRLLDYSAFKVIGVKTGTTAAAGQCLVAAAEQQRRRLISVVLGSADRYGDTLQLLNYGFNHCSWCKPVGRDPVLTVPVRDGVTSRLRVGVKDDGEIALKPGELRKLEKRYRIRPELRAPLTKGSLVGKIEVYLGDYLLYTDNLVALETVNKGLPCYRKLFRKWR